MACSTFCDFDERAALRAIAMPSFSLPVDENLYIDIWRHLAASYSDVDRRACPGFVSYSLTPRPFERCVSNPLVPRFDQTSTLVVSTIRALLQRMSDYAQQSQFSALVFTSFDVDDYTKVQFEPGVFFRDTASPVLRYYRLADIIATRSPSSTLCLAYKQTLCVVLQTPLPAPTCVHPFIRQTTALARLFDTPSLRGFTMQTASDLPYPYLLVAGFRTSFVVRPIDTTVGRVGSCDAGLVDSSGGGVRWRPVEWSLVQESDVMVTFALDVANIDKLHVFRLVVNDSALVMSYTHPLQHAPLPKCTGVSCTVSTRTFYQSLQFQCLLDNSPIPRGSKWAVRVASSTGRRFETAPAPVVGGTACLFDYTVEDGSTNTATVTITLGKCTQSSSWKTSLASPFVFT